MRTDNTKDIDFLLQEPGKYKNLEFTEKENRIPGQYINKY